jgi:hypothetical protein
MVATPVQDARHSNQMSFLIAHEPHVVHVVAPAVDTLVEPVLIAQRFPQLSPGC